MRSELLGAYRFLMKCGTSNVSRR